MQGDNSIENQYLGIDFVSVRYNVLYTPYLFLKSAYNNICTHTIMNVMFECNRYEINKYLNL